jgi:ABC-type amino acid transport substrate-binding protein
MSSLTKWPRRIWFAALLGSCCCLLPAVAQERPSSAAPLRVGVSPVFPPMVFKQNGELVGVEADLARAFGDALGRKVEFVELPWADQTDALISGRIDIIMSSMSITMARRFVIDFTRPYLLVGQMTLVRREDQGRYVLGYPITPSGTVGVLKATTGEFLVQREFPKASRKVYTSGTEAAQALKKKKIDLFISDSTLIWYLAGMNAAEGLSAVPIPLSEEQLAWGVRKGDDKLLAAANGFIEKSSKDGSLNRIFRRWTAIAP